MTIKVREGALRRLRMERWLTQEELAKLSGVSIPTLNRVERVPPDGMRKETLLKLAKALKVKPEAIAVPPKETDEKATEKEAANA